MLPIRFALPATPSFALALCASCSPTIPLGENDPDGSTPDAYIATPDARPTPDACATCPPDWTSGYTRVSTTVDGQVVDVDVYLPDGTDDGSRVLVRDPAYRRIAMTRIGTLAGGAVEFDLYGALRFDRTERCLTLDFGTPAFASSPGRARTSGYRRRQSSTTARSSPSRRRASSYAPRCWAGSHR